MKELDYQNFFNKLIDFKNIQIKQKQQGLNDYNMVNIVRKATHEVGMHSNVIYSLLNPNGLHYQDDLFLQIFIREVLDIQDFGEILSVEAEESTSENKRIDFTIKSSKYYIGIEMKVNHHDSKHQLFDYYVDLKKKAIKNKISEEISNNLRGVKGQDNVLIYYLTKYGKKASIKSSNGIQYEQISFRKHILKWIDICQEEVKNITNLNEAFENYKNIVKKITNKYEGNVMTLNEYMNKTENQHMYEQIGSIKNELISLQKEVESKFWVELEEELNKTNNYEFKKENNWEKLKVGLKSEKLGINIIRNHNLYYDIVNTRNKDKIIQYINHTYKGKKVAWEYIIPQQNNNTEKINFEKANHLFWKLGEDTFRHDIINQIVNIINDLVKKVDS